MTLRQKQSQFAWLVSQLIIKADKLGFEMTLGEVYRSPEEAARLAKLGKGIKNSLHTDKLAIDINLFKDGRFLTSTKAHEQLGEWWESMSTESIKCAWGGRFGDGNHYSVEHNGKK